VDLTVHQLHKVLDGELDLLIEPLMQAEQARRLLEEAPAN
jgi:protein subunit release factor A